MHAVPSYHELQCLQVLCTVITNTPPLNQQLSSNRKNHYISFSSNQLNIFTLYFNLQLMLLQCFDAVVWAAGMASSL